MDREAGGGVRRLHLLQRIVVVVALGAALFLVGVYFTARVGRTGWFAYAPLESGSVSHYFPFSPRDGLTSLENLFVWLGLVLGWCAGSLAVLRIRTTNRRRLTRTARAGETGT